MKKLKTIRKTLFVVYVALIMVGAITTPIYAANDPVTVVNNFSDFMFGMIPCHRYDSSWLRYCTGRFIFKES